MILNLRARLVCPAFFLFLLPMGICLAQDEDKSAKKTETIDVQIQVTDSTDGAPIGNVQVQIKWGDGDSDSEKAVTNQGGVAKLKDVPRGVVTVRLIAHGYKNAAPSVNLKTEKQPIKLSLDKQAPPSQ